MLTPLLLLASSLVGVRSAAIAAANKFSYEEQLDDGLAALMPPTPEGVSNWWTGSSALPLWDPTKGKASLEAMETMSLTELFQPPKGSDLERMMNTAPSAPNLEELLKASSGVDFFKRKAGSKVRVRFDLDGYSAWCKDYPNLCRSRRFALPASPESLDAPPCPFTQFELQGAFPCGSSDASWLFENLFHGERVALEGWNLLWTPRPCELELSAAARSGWGKDFSAFKAGSLPVYNLPSAWNRSPFGGVPPMDMFQMNVQSGGQALGNGYGGMFNFNFPNNNNNWANNFPGFDTSNFGNTWQSSDPWPPAIYDAGGILGGTARGGSGMMGGRAGAAMGLSGQSASFGLSGPAGGMANVYGFGNNNFGNNFGYGQQLWGNNQKGWNGNFANFYSSRGSNSNAGLFNNQMGWNFWKK